jgi:CelD/BcsL family acetyltransferase involved in cellulose biosynthesis
MDLVQDSSFSAPFHTWHWNWIGWKALSGDQGRSSHRALHVGVIEDSAGRPLAIAPLMQERTRLRGLPIRQLAFMPSLAHRRALLFRDGVAKNEAMEAIAGYLVNCRRHWDMMTLIGFDAESSDLALFVASVEARGLTAVRHDAYTSPYILIGDDFQDFLQRTLHRKRRINIGREVRRLTERSFRIVEFTRPEEMQQAMDLAFAVCRSSWKTKTSLAITNSATRTQFYREIAVHFACHGQTRIWVAMLDEQPVAVEFHVEGGNKFYFMMTEFDQDYAKLSPGTVLLYKVLEQLHGEPIDELDFGGEAYDYKMKWATGVRKHVSLEIFNGRPYPRVLYLAKNRLMPAFRRIFAHKALVAPSEAREPSDE